MRKIAIDLVVIVAVFLIGFFVGASAVSPKTNQSKYESENQTDSVVRVSIMQSDSIQLLKADSLRSLIRASQRGGN